MAATIGSLYGSLIEQILTLPPDNSLKTAETTLTHRLLATDAAICIWSMYTLALSSALEYHKL